jgi:hypothetical protein
MVRGSKLVQCLNLPCDNSKVARSHLLWFLGWYNLQFTCNCVTDGPRTASDFAEGGQWRGQLAFKLGHGSQPVCIYVCPCMPYLSYQ